MAQRAVDPIRALAAKLEPAMARAFLRAVAALAGHISVAELARAMERGQLTIQITRALDLWPADLRAAVAVVNEEFVQGGITSATRLNGDLRVSTAFDLTNEFAVEWGRTRSAFLVREITERQRALLQNVIARSIVEGIPPRDAARLIKPIIGLTDAQAVSVLNHANELGEASARRYAARLLRQR